MDRMDRILEQWARIRPDLDTSEIAVIGRILRAARLLERGINEVFGAFGLNRGEFDVLASLLRAGPPHALTPTALSDALLLSTSAMTNRIDRLERAGLVRRERDPSDRREVRVHLTPRGLSLTEHALNAYVAAAPDLLAPLAGAERGRLGPLLRRLLAGLEGCAIAVDEGAPEGLASQA